LQRGVNNSVALPGGSRLDILVENMGRINYGPYLRDPKGIPDGVLWQGHYVHGWEAFPLPLTQVASLKFGPYVSSKGPSFFRGTFMVNGTPYDTFLVTAGWSKGCAFVNGFNVGRYWKVGPQYSLYIPAALLRSGENEIILFETENTTAAFVTLQENPINRI